MMGLWNGGDGPWIGVHYLLLTWMVVGMGMGCFCFCFIVVVSRWGHAIFFSMSS